MQVATLDYDDFLGYVAVGRIIDGHIKVGDRVLLAHRDGKMEQFRTQKVLASQGLKRFEIAEGTARRHRRRHRHGRAQRRRDHHLDRVARGILEAVAIDEPTISMQFIANNGPFVGKEGKYVTTRNLRERLEKELKSNVALRVAPTDQADIFKVSGRGELHLSVLIETMRREGFELCVSQPEVIFHTDKDGKKLEPYEDVHDRRRRGLLGRGHREARLARRPHDRDVAVGRRARAHGVHRADARPHRLSLGVPHRHARHRDPQQHLPRVRRVRRQDEAAARGRAHRERAGRDQRLRHVLAAGARLAVPRRRRSTSTRGRSSASTRARTISSSTRARRRRSTTSAPPPPTRSWSSCRRASCRSRRRSSTSTPTSSSR